MKKNLLTRIHHLWLNNLWNLLNWPRDSDCESTQDLGANRKQTKQWGGKTKNNKPANILHTAKKIFASVYILFPILSPTFTFPDGAAEQTLEKIYDNEPTTVSGHNINNKWGSSDGRMGGCYSVVGGRWSVVRGRGQCVTEN